MRRFVWIPLFWLIYSWSPLLAKDWLSVPMSSSGYAEFSKWEVGQHKTKKDVETTVWVPKGENINNWTKKFSVQTFRKPWVGPSLQSLVDQLKEGISRSCPALTWNVTESSENEISYEYSFEHCQGKDMHEIGKWIQGKDSQFWLQYTHTVKELDPDERKVWMQIICGSKVTQGGR